LSFSGQKTTATFKTVTIATPLYTRGVALSCTFTAQVLDSGLNSHLPKKTVHQPNESCKALHNGNT